MSRRTARLNPRNWHEKNERANALEPWRRRIFAAVLSIYPTYPLKTLMSRWGMLQSIIDNRAQIDWHPDDRDPTRWPDDLDEPFPVEDAVKIILREPGWEATAIRRFRRDASILIPLDSDPVYESYFELASLIDKIAAAHDAAKYYEELAARAANEGDDERYAMLVAQLEIARDDMAAASARMAQIPSIAWSFV